MEISETEKKEKKNSGIYYTPPEDRRCTAKSKQSGQRCQRWAAKGSRVCHYHGARSRGPRTPEGKERSQMARLKHGEYALDILKARLLKRVLTVAAQQASLLASLPDYLTEVLRQMKYQRYRDVRPHLSAFCREDIGIRELITRLDGKSSRVFVWTEQDKRYQETIKKCLNSLLTIDLGDSGVDL